MADTVYLDFNATCPLRIQAFDRMTAILRETGNPSSIHSFGRAARQHVETARATLAQIFDVGPGQVVFNSGATEGNNTILHGFAGRRILLSAVEHPSLTQAGVPFEIIPVTSSGLVDLDLFSQQLKRGDTPALVSVQLVNNETGVIQPVADIAAIAKSAGALFHADAVQGFGRIPFTRASLNADFLTVSSHKIGGPHGAGAIVYAAGAPLPKLLRGGGQERRARAGTENVAGIAGFGIAAQMAAAKIDEFQALAAWRDTLEARLGADPRITIFGIDAPRVANTTCFSFAGFSADTQMMNYDLAGIAVSSGSACSSGSIAPSAVLSAMGVPDALCRTAIRVSSGWSTTEKDMEIFLSAWDKLAARI